MIGQAHLSRTSRNRLFVPLGVLLAVGIIVSLPWPHHAPAGAVPLPAGAPTPGAHLPPIQTVFLLVFQNHAWDEVKTAPYIHSLVQIGSHAERYYTPPKLHPSEPNYIWLEAGTNCFDGKCYTTDADVSASNHISSTAHLVTQLKDAGISWKAYLEDIPGDRCPTSSFDRYAVKHSGMIFFDDVWNAPGTYCQDHLRPYAELARDLAANTVARYNFIAPNTCNDMHDCSVATGDEWLSRRSRALWRLARIRRRGPS